MTISTWVRSPAFGVRQQPPPPYSSVYVNSVGEVRFALFVGGNYSELVAVVIEWKMRSPGACSLRTKKPALVHQYPPTPTYDRHADRPPHKTSR